MANAQSEARVKARRISIEAAEALLAAAIEAEYVLTKDIEAACWEDEASDSRYPIVEQLRASIAMATTKPSSQSGEPTVG